MDNILKLSYLVTNLSPGDIDEVTILLFSVPNKKIDAHRVSAIVASGFL